MEEINVKEKYIYKIMLWKWANLIFSGLLASIIYVKEKSDT